MSKPKVKVGSCIKRLTSMGTPWIFCYVPIVIPLLQNASSAKLPRNSTTPIVINTDKQATYPPAMAALQENKTLPLSTKLRQNKYLSNVIEQDHRSISGG